MIEDQSGGFSPVPEFPQNAEFYRQVLDVWPSPMLVVDELGQLIYGNRALVTLGGWDIQGGVGTSVLDYVHPDDVEALAEGFFDLAESSKESTLETATPWSTIYFRLIAANGQTIPVEVTGAGGLTDPTIGGIVYDIRPAYEHDILRRGLTGLAEGEPIDEILGLIADMIALPPLELDAAILEPRGDGTYRVIGATNRGLEEILIEARDPTPWNMTVRTPRRTMVSQLPGGVGEDLFAAGYREFWHISPESAAATEAYQIVACRPTVHRPVAGPVDRLARANELASVVLLRARADALLEHSATHDRLTALPNREGFYRRASEAIGVASEGTTAMLFIDLDGFKEVNDQHGHAAGDHVLQTIASRLVAVTRSVDLVARLGGDEFVVLLGASQDRPANHQRVQALADRTLEQVRRDIEVGDDVARVSASIGAVIVKGPISVDDILAKADAAMYEAKRASGNQHKIVES